MKDIAQIRKSINDIDSEITKLYEKRMDLTKDVAEYKKANDLPIYDVSREEDVIERNLKYLKNKELEKYYKEFLQFLMDQSKEIQKQLIETL